MLIWCGRKSLSKNMTPYVLMYILLCEVNQITQSKHPTNFYYVPLFFILCVVAFLIFIACHNPTFLQVRRESESTVAFTLTGHK